MRVNTINASNNQNRNQNPSFGMNVTYNKGFKIAVEAMSERGASAREISQGLNKLMNDISDTVTLTFTNDDKIPSKMVPRIYGTLTERGKEILSFSYEFSDKVVHHMKAVQETLYKTASFLNIGIPMKNQNTVNTLIDHTISRINN